MDRPLSERRALLESGRCFAPISHYLELSEATLINLDSPDAPLQVHFDAARRSGEEGVMVKAAHRPYVPNARTNSLKVKVEFIPGLGDTVTLRLYGARVPRTLGRGTATATHRIAEFVVGAAGDDGEPQWLCNTSQLPWQDANPNPNPNPKPNPNPNPNPNPGRTLCASPTCRRWLGLGLGSGSGLGLGLG